MTMQRPDARIICGDLQDKMSRDRKYLHISALWVYWPYHSAIPFGGISYAFNKVVVAVQVNRVGDWRLVDKDDANGRVGPKIVNVPFRTVRI